MSMECGSNVGMWVPCVLNNFVGNLAAEYSDQIDSLFDLLDTVIRFVNDILGPMIGRVLESLYEIMASM